MTQTLILKGKKDFWQRQPVYIRWSNGQVRKFKKTNLSLTKEQFDKFKKGEPGKDRDLYQKFLNAINEKPDDNKTDFYKYASQLIKIRTEDKAPETIRQNESEVNKLKAYKSSLLLKDVTPDFLQGYKTHLVKLGNKNNTLWKSFKFVRLVILSAIKNKLITDNPFDIFEMPRYKDPDKLYNTEDEIKAYEAINDLPEGILFAKDWYVIGCYTGLRFGDMAAFDRRKNVVNNRLVLYTKKTRDVVSLPFTDKLRELFDKVDYKAIPYSNTHFNRLLKQVDPSLNAHKARHSFAVLCASKGISQEVTAKLLGHSNLKTTEIYYKITGKRIDSEFQKVAP